VELLSYALMRADETSLPQGEVSVVSKLEGRGEVEKKRPLLEEKALFSL
jgi:hypothetical protein